MMKPGSGTLVIDISGEKAEAYEGAYQCTAHNEHGTALSNKIIIRQSSKALRCVALPSGAAVWTYSLRRLADLHPTRRVPLVVEGEK